MMFRRFLPSQCAVCHAWPTQPVCAKCEDTFAHTPPTMPEPDAEADTAWDTAFAAVAYAYPWIGLIADFKFHQHPAWARYFADLLRRNPAVVDALAAADDVISIPLSPHRLQERGYNQALLLARALNRTKTQSQALLRVGETAIQHTLSRSQRLQNLRNAFMVHPVYLRQAPQRRVVLVDDVMTTGASLHAAATILRRAGVAHITVMVVAYTELVFA